MVARSTAQGRRVFATSGERLRASVHRRKARNQEAQLKRFARSHCLTAALIRVHRELDRFMCCGEV